MWVCISLEHDEYSGTKIIGLLKFLVFAFTAPPFSMGETLHIAYKKYKIKRKFIFFINTKYILSLS